jgi:DNA-binding transcriptional regulator of glucitol operon
MTPRTMTWVDKANHYWRIESLAGRWQLSRYSPTSETWQRIGSFPTRDGAIQAAYEKNSGAL